MAVSEQIALKTTGLTFHEGPVEVHDDVRLNRRWYTYDTDLGLVAGSILNIVFGIDRPVGEVWSHMKDFNQWQNSYDHYYSTVVGDLSEGELFTLSAHPDAPPLSTYQVLRNVPEHFLVFSQPIPESSNGDAPEGETPTSSGWQGHRLPGVGGISPGFHIFMLNGDGDGTIVTITMQHASVMVSESGEPAMTPEEAVDAWREIGADGVMKWRDIFIPNLKKLVYDVED